MKKAWKRMLAVVLTFALLLCAAPLGDGNIAFAAATNPAKVNVEQAQKRLDQLIKLFEGKYFTVNQTYCVKGPHSDSNCTNCYMPYIVKADWCKQLVGMGTLDWQKFPAQYDYSHTNKRAEKNSVAGYQCYGFANFAHWYIFAQKNTDNLVSTLEACGPMTYETLQKARPGDVIWTDAWNPSHSMIFISCDKSGYKVLDCNYKKDPSKDPACKVQVHTVAYNKNYMAVITGVDNYDRDSGIDTSAPVISNVTISDENATGFTVNCTVKDNVAVDRVQFVAWSQVHGKDDIEANWATSTVCKGKQSGESWSFRVDIKRHNNERGAYSVDIVAYDQAGNSSQTSTSATVRAQYTVTYDANGGSGAPSAQIKTEDKPLTLSDQIPVLEGHTFIGWQGSAKNANGEWSCTCPATGTYERGYQYYVYGGELNKDATGWYDNTRSFPASKVSNEALVRFFSLVSKEDKGDRYTVDGVTVGYVATNGTTGTANIKNTKFYKGPVMYRQTDPVSVMLQPGETYSVNGDIVLQAVWEENTPQMYTITYDANGGKNAPSAQPKLQGQQAWITNVIPDRTDHVFCGWALDAAADNAVYQPGDAYVSDADITLYAVWQEKEAETFDINYDANGGSNAPERQQKAGGQSILLRADVPSREGYVFLGWALDHRAEAAVYRPGDSYAADENVTLYAVWQQEGPETCSVRFDANGGRNAPSAQEKLPGQELILSDTIPVKDGYIFSGWASGSNMTQPEYQPGDSYSMDADMILYAVWQKDMPANAPCITIGQAQAKRGEKIEVPVSLENNPGIAGLSLTFQYDAQQLELVSVSKEKAFDGIWYIDQKAVWVSKTEDSQYNGTILTLTFRVADTAQAEPYEISVSYAEGDICNTALDNVHFETRPGRVVVSTQLVGDINGDGKIDIKDFIALIQSLASGLASGFIEALDIDKNGVINVKDLVSLLKLLSGQEIEIG